MNIRILRSDDLRISSAISQRFTAGSIVSVPRATAELLIGKGVAEAVAARGKTKPAIEEKTHADR